MDKSNIEIYEICDFDDDFLEQCELLESFIQKCSMIDKVKYSEIYSWDLDYIVEIAPSALYELYIMIYKGSIIGCLKIDFYSDNIYISDILISKKYRGNGLAKMLINSAIENNMDNDNQKYCELDVQCLNTNAILAYTKMGFIACGFYHDGKCGWLKMKTKKKR